MIVDDDRNMLYALRCIDMAHRAGEEDLGIANIIVFELEDLDYVNNDHLTVEGYRAMSRLGGPFPYGVSKVGIQA